MLLSKLERYGIRGLCNDWFQSYLLGRTLKANVRTSEHVVTKSDTFKITYGTAQGSCLGPLLYYILMIFNYYHFLVMLFYLLMIQPYLLVLEMTNYYDFILNMTCYSLLTCKVLLLAFRWSCLCVCWFLLFLFAIVPEVSITLVVH